MKHVQDAAVNVARPFLKLCDAPTRTRLVAFTSSEAFVEGGADVVRVQKEIEREQPQHARDLHCAPPAAPAMRADGFVIFEDVSVCAGDDD